MYMYVYLYIVYTHVKCINQMCEMWLELKTTKASDLNLIFNMCATVQQTGSDGLSQSQFLDIQSFYI